MKTKFRFTNSGALALASLGLTLAGCSGSGSGAGGASSSFTVENVSVLNGSSWQINRPIEIRFSEDVDFSTVNFTTIQIAKTSGAPAAGEFREGTTVGGALDPRRVVFFPRCPTLSDYSDAGLEPGGVAYRINVVGGGSALTVRSTTNHKLDLGQTVNFTTPNSTQASLLFVDTVTGPPAAVVRTDSSTLDASYIELGGSSAVQDRVYFQPRQVFDADLGADVPSNFLAPLNLYSDSSQQVAIVAVINQPIDPSSTNINSSTVRLEYEDGTSWIPLAHEVTLAANCTETGAVVRVTPTGILPQDRVVRVVISSALRDVVGQVNLVDVVVGSFRVKVSYDPGTTNPGPSADEKKEEFTDTSGEDQVSQLSSPTAPRATWGNGVLMPNFDFAGTGGPPDGQFDYEIGSSIPGSPPENPILDTTFTLITDATQSRTQAVVNGVIDVRNFTLNQNSSLTVLGPNPLKIYASGIVNIQGSLVVRGSNSKGVATLNTTCIPEIGADGNAGGGKGGSGSYLTTQSTPKGEDGRGAFNAQGLGGGGGHTAFRSSGDTGRRPAGGGGGRFGPDVTEVIRSSCPDQSVVGMDAENGFPGHPLAGDAILGSGVKPQGGTRGPQPFGDSDPTNDFFGLKVVTGTSQVIRGELPQPWAGAGGGGGGDSCQTASFPTTPFSCSGDEKGCGGGGGGGCVVILALGDIIIGTKGKIDVTGGAGGGGENSLSGGITRIGGGSGGGSGGHIILQSASQVDLSNCSASNGSGLFARGGEGGAGNGDNGGAHAPGSGPYSASLDALPPNSYPTTGTSAGACAVTSGLWTGSFQYTFSNTIGNGGLNDGTPMGPDNNVVTGCGGDGGPGLIQIHVQRLSSTPANSDLKIPSNTALNPVRLIVSPTPVGSTPANAQTLGSWDQMLPQFGRFSTGVSEWIPLGGAGVTIGSSTPHAVQFKFGGTNSGTGLVNAAGGLVTQLPACLSGTLAANPTLPFATADLRTLVFDASGLDDLYKRNATLMKRFGVFLTHAAATTEFEVVSATYDNDLDQVRLTLATSGAPLQPFVVGDAISVIPRFFRISTNGTNDALPASSTIQVRFQAAPADAAGNPTLTGATGFLTDASQIQVAAGAANFKFVRFRVDFDILADGSSLTFSTPRPKIDFLRLPFKF